LNPLVRIIAPPPQTAEVEEEALEGACDGELQPAAAGSMLIGTEDTDEGIETNNGNAAAPVLWLGTALSSHGGVATAGNGGAVAAELAWDPPPEEAAADAMGLYKGQRKSG
jgi:hypothetical protein